jgi:hypothetical protein
MGYRFGGVEGEFAAAAVVDHGRSLPQGTEEARGSVTMEGQSTSGSEYRLPGKVGSLRSFVLRGKRGGRMGKSS